MHVTEFSIVSLSTQFVIRPGKQIRKIGFGFDLNSFGLDQVQVNSSGITFLNPSFFPEIQWNIIIIKMNVILVWTWRVLLFLHRVSPLCLQASPYVLTTQIFIECLLWWGLNKLFYKFNPKSFYSGMVWDFFGPSTWNQYWKWNQIPQWMSRLLFSIF